MTKFLGKESDCRRNLQGWRGGVCRRFLHTKGLFPGHCRFVLSLEGPVSFPLPPHQQHTEEKLGKFAQSTLTFHTASSTTVWCSLPSVWRCSLPLRMSSSYLVSWQLKGIVMSTAEHNTGLAKLQQELDKFNEDRQGEQRLEQRKKIEQRLPVTVGQTNFQRREE